MAKIDQAAMVVKKTADGFEVAGERIKGALVEVAQLANSMLTDGISPQQLAALRKSAKELDQASVALDTEADQLHIRENMLDAVQNVLVEMSDLASGLAADLEAWMKTPAKAKKATGRSVKSASKPPRRGAGW